jgi:cytochrome c-type biogenesis protein CcmH/NrfG
VEFHFWAVWAHAFAHSCAASKGAQGRVWATGGGTTLVAALSVRRTCLRLWVVEVQADMPAPRLKRSHASLSALAEMENTVSRMRGVVRMISEVRPELW